MRTHFLLIDDDEDELEILRTAVKGLDIDVDFSYAPTPEKAITLLDILVPDFIFLDINMPGLNGLELLKLIRKKVNQAKTCIVMYSTGMDGAIAKEAKQLGASTSIKKTGTIDQLIFDLTNLLRIGGDYSNIPPAR